MCIILFFFPFSISLLTICTIHSLEYVLSIPPLRFSSQQWNAILLFIGVKFSFINILSDFSRPTDVLSKFFKSFLPTRAFFACFLLTNHTIVVFEKFFDFPIRWQPSIYFLLKVMILSIVFRPSDFKFILSTILL